MISNKFRPYLIFFGILSVKNQSFPKVSKVHLIVNCIKLILWHFINKIIFLSAHKYFNPHISSFKISYFMIKFLKFLRFNYCWNPQFIVAYQILTTRKNIELMTQVERFEQHLSQHCEPARKIYDDLKKENVKIFMTIHFVMFIYINEIFFLGMELSVVSYFFTFLNCFNYFILTAFLCYIVVLLKFLSKSQIIFLKHLNAIKDHKDIEEILDQLAKWQSELYYIKELFVSTLCLPILTLIFFFIYGILVEVSFKTFHKIQN